MNNMAIATPTRGSIMLAANSKATTRLVRTAATTDKVIAVLTRLIRRSIARISASRRSCSSPRAASSRGSISRERSTIRDRREAQTLRKAPIPVSRNTGATASRTESATVVSGM